MTDAQTSKMQEEIRRLALYIIDAKKEILALGAVATPAVSIGDASQHLDEVIKATETASNTIMDNADIIQAQASGIGGEKEKKILDATSEIYTACNFQDLTGQRLTKVIKLLMTIEERVTNLNNLFGVSAVVPLTAKPIIDANGNYNEKDLLNGPQLAKEASSQSDVDALFGNGTK